MGKIPDIGLSLFSLAEYLASGHFPSVSVLASGM